MCKQVCGNTTVCGEGGQLRRVVVDGNNTGLRVRA